ncbi:MAG: response regulator [Kiritimatiellae bacterium]|nr:response regulator [Kiritimatiellia bacterium]
MSGMAKVNVSVTGPVLIVDDEEGIRELFRTILSTYLPGVQVELVANGAEAVERFRLVHHSLLIMDLHMPVMDGLTAFIQIQDACTRESEVMPPVVFCTGYSPPDSVRALIAEGSPHHLMLKPVKPLELVGIVQKRLSA